MNTMQPPSPRLINRATYFILPFVLATLTFVTRQASAQDQADQQAQQLVDSDQVLHHLNNTITWYRNMTNQVQPVGLPSDAIYQANAEAIAAQVVKHAFESAEKSPPLIAAEKTPDSSTSSSASSRQKLMQFVANTTANNVQLQTQLNALDAKIATASRKNLPALKNQRDLLEGELDLGQSMLKSINQLVQSPNTKGQPATGGFLGSIEQLKGSIPEVFDPKAKSATASGNSQSASVASGLISKLNQIYKHSLSLREIENLQLETSRLENLVNGMRDPFRNAMRTTVQQGRDLSAAADHSQAGQAPPTKQDFEQLATKFDQLAAVEIPLSQESSALEESKANLSAWRDSITGQYRLLLRSVFISVAIIVGVLGLLLLVSNLWKKMTFRYVSDARRRRQFLIVRRFVISFLIGLVLTFSFVTEFSALATFAGFITAGLAVGLQTILLCIAAYFFLIGRYGIRVGDRISIMGVTGDVIDVGFVRFYMLEVGGTGVDLQPTGRVVAFPNSILFTATAPMFRQVPGAAYSWHEIAVPLQTSGNHELVEQKMLDVVNSVYKDYKAALEHQHGLIEQRFEIPLSPLLPKAQLQLTSSGLEAVVRYPVGLRHSVDADDRITRKLVEVIGTSEELKSSVSGLPVIRSSFRS